MKQPKKKLASLRLKKQALYILIFSFVTVLVWVGGSLFSSQSKSGIEPELKDLAESLNPVINIELVEEMEQKEYFNDEELGYFEIYKLIKSKDGRTQKIVPIDSSEDEIEEEEIELRVGGETSPDARGEVIPKRRSVGG